MYLWKLVGHDTSEDPLCSGLGEDLAAIMRLIEGYLKSGTGFVGHVTEVATCLSVLDLDAMHVTTGREWLSRRDSRGGIYWQSRYRPAGPNAPCYSYRAGDDLGASAH